MRKKTQKNVIDNIITVDSIKSHAIFDEHFRNTALRSRYILNNDYEYQV